MEDKRLLLPVKESWLESGSVYSYRKVSDDWREPYEQCGSFSNDLSPVEYGKQYFQRLASF